jgi:hypothetical protein
MGQDGPYRASRSLCPKRAQSDDQSRAVWNPIGKMDRDFGEFVRFLMLSRQGLGEISGLQDTYASRNQQTACLPGELTKSAEG